MAEDRAKWRKSVESILAQDTIVSIGIDEEEERYTVSAYLDDKPDPYSSFRLFHSYILTILEIIVSHSVVTNVTYFKKQSYLYFSGDCTLRINSIYFKGNVLTCDYLIYLITKYFSLKNIIKCTLRVCCNY